MRRYIEEQVGKEYLVPLIGIWNDFDSIDFSKLPNQFVLKCTHDSGGVVICSNKNMFDISSAKSKLKKHMKRNFYWHAREFPYKNVCPRIICEKYLVDESKTELKDYKLYCFNGKPKFMQVDFDRFTEHKKNLYDLTWNSLPFEMNFHNSPHIIIPKPIHLDRMIDIAKKLSAKYTFLRVDFYVIEDKVYIGELTFFPAAGVMWFDPPEYDAILGDELII